MFTSGPKDFCTIFFYALAWIVVHAVIQEYIWDVSIKILFLSIIIILLLEFSCIAILGFRKIQSILARVC